MKLIVFLLLGVGLWSCTNQSKNENNNIKSLDTLLINGRIYPLDSISKSEYEKDAYVFPGREDTTSIDSTRIQIMPSGILIHTENSGSIPFKNDTSMNDSRVLYFYVKTLGKIHSAHISAHHYEWSVDHLINLKTGNRIEMWGSPYVSPDKKFLISFSGDLVAGFMPNGIQLFEIKDDRFEKIFDKETGKWEPTEVKWHSDSVVYLKVAKINFKNMERKFSYLKMIIM